MKSAKDYSEDRSALNFSEGKTNFYIIVSNNKLKSLFSSNNMKTQDESQDKIPSQMNRRDNAKKLNQEISNNLALPFNYYKKNKESHEQDKDLKDKNANTFKEFMQVQYNRRQQMRKVS